MRKHPDQEMRLPLYRRWGSMKARCYNVLDRAYARYGGKGITVCKRWHSFENFYTDMRATFERHLELDRINSAGNYKPSNCRWVTRQQNQRNKRSNVNLTMNGETKCLAEWAAITGLSYGTMWERKCILGWDDERVLTTPAMNAATRCKLARAKYSALTLERRTAK